MRLVRLGGAGIAAWSATILCSRCGDPAKRWRLSLAWHRRVGLKPKPRL